MVRAWSYAFAVTMPAALGPLSETLNLVLPLTWPWTSTLDPRNVTCMRSTRPLDLAVQKALKLMAAKLDERWTVTRLARSVGLSRPVFARRFVAMTGSSPLRYLTRARMERAAKMLETSNAGLAEIAKQVGYASEFAFNRAFKRHHNLAPGAFRRAFASDAHSLPPHRVTPAFKLAA